MIALQVRKPNFSQLRVEGRRYARAQEKANHVAVDKASRAGYKRTQMAMRAAGLGRLERAVGHTSSLRKGERHGRNAWGVIYAKGQTRADDRGAGALEAYSEGATIKPKNTLFGTGWLWIATNRIPTRVRRYRMTPALYNRSPLVASIGPLVFRRIASNRAILVIKRVSVSPKTGRAKALGNRRTRTRIAMKEVVAFVGIKVTRRMRRFNQRQIMALAGKMVPRLQQQEQDAILSRGM